MLPKTELLKVQESEKIGEESIQEISPDTVITYLSDEVIKKMLLKVLKQILPKQYKNENTHAVFSADWDKDNFGLITVPIGKYFLLGDNRNYSQDSRYLGFIDKSQYVATVLYNK